QGTIEEGMLGVLKFKKSLFAGVLDGGEKEVFLGGTRLTKFMESVEAATTAIPPVMPEAEPEPAPAPAEAERAPAEGPPPAPAESPWAGLLEAGLSLLQQFTAPGGNGHAARALVQRDERTGEEYLRLPIPPPAVVDQALTALQLLLTRLR